MFAPVYLLGFLAVVYARTHRLIVGNLVLPASLYVLEFDDQSLDFRIISNNTAESSHAWITFGQTKDTIYGASLNSTKTSQYALDFAAAAANNNNNNNNKSSIHLVGSAPNCGDQTSAYVIASSQRAPYDVYGAALPGPGACGTAFSPPLSLSPNATNEATWAYGEESGVRGLALAFNDTVLYSADLTGNSIWTHRIGGSGGGSENGDGDDDGTQIEQVGRFQIQEGLGPRHLLVHPGEQYLHVIMETANELITYDINPDTHEPGRAVSVWNFLPGVNVQDYWAAEVALSPNGRYLWISTRAREDADVGYLSAYLLSEEGYVDRRMFTVPTTTTGGIANSVSPAPWSDEIVAMTDFGTGYVQIWKMTQPRESGVGFLNATAIARVDIKDGGCCANVLWYD